MCRPADLAGSPLCCYAAAVWTWASPFPLEPPCPELPRGGEPQSLAGLSSYVAATGRVPGNRTTAATVIRGAVKLYRWKRDR